MNEVDKLVLELLQYDPLREWRGATLEFIKSAEPEVILCGPAETGKSFAACYKSHIACREYPKAQGALVRKTASSIPGTILLTMKRIIGNFPVEYYGGEKTPERIVYPNGSVIWIGGMDNPAKVLSGERDFIQVCQAEELTLDDWETMTTRTTGRGSVMPYTQVFGDCNPAGSKNYIPLRAKTGKLKLINSRHVDNPTLYDNDGNITEQGKRTIEALSNLTGIRRKRLFEGIWATAEGAVYEEFDASIHVKKMDRTQFQYALLAIDEGYTNPAVVLVVLVDGDGRLHIQEEFYQRGVLQAGVCERAKQYSLQYNATTAIVDAAAAGLIAELRNVSINAIGHKGRVLDGISIVQALLKVQGDGKPRLTISPDCVNTINEFESYVWRAGKDEPVKEFDHCFSGNTNILTKTGLKPIKDIRVGEFVWSPFGWNEVYRSGSTGIKKTKDYGIFRCTPDHRIPTTNGIKKVDTIGYSDKIMVWEKQKPYTSMEFLIGAIQTPKMEMMRFISDALLTKAWAAKQDFYTEIYGNTITVKFLMAIWFIMLTGILATTILVILSLSALKNMLNAISGVFGMGCKNISKVFKKKQKNGIGQTRVKSGTFNMLKKHGITEFFTNLFARFAEKNILHPSLKEANTVIKTAKQQPCEEEEVYNLATKWGLYFANGVLVCNSMDALRYLSHWLYGEEMTMTEVSYTPARIGEGW
jgi:PBSX family phage terminase large subunit